MPLLAISALCVAEAIVIAFLLGRGPPERQSSQPAPAAPSQAPGPVSPPAQPPAVGNDAGRAAADSTGPAAPAGGAAIVRGKVGQRVQSGGLAITVVGVTNEPRYKEVTAPPASQKFVGVEVLLENTGDRDHPYFSTNFKIKDPQDRVYASGGLGVGDPPLDWGTIVPGEKVRGHVAFVVPRDATGLALAYVPPGGGPPNYRPIHIDLGQ